MKKIILVNGIIAGVIVSAMLLISLPLQERKVIDMDNGIFIGYASMVIALSMVFFGIKKYRDQYQNGLISFGQAFKIGILISLLASALYTITWEIYYNTVAHDFLDKYTQHYIEKMEREGASETEIKEARIEMEEFNEGYKNNPIIRLSATLVEILPVGLIITLISAAVLKRRERL